MDSVVAGLAGEVAGILAAGSRAAAAADNDIEAMSVLVDVYWLRYQHLPEGQDQDDLRACLTWSMVLLPVAPDTVPEPIRAALAAGRIQARTTDTDPADATSDNAIALAQEYQQTGNIDRLQTAITLFRHAVADTPTDHPDRPVDLSNLGNALQFRYGRSGQQADLDEAITLFRQAVDTTPTNHPNQPVYLSNLGGALQVRYGHSGQQADLDEAITTGRQAVDTTPTNC